MQSATNKSLYDLIKALSGTTDFTDEEDTLLLSLANFRLRTAYDTTDAWPRYLISYEPRTMNNQVIPLTEDAFYIFGAGTTAVDGLFTLNGTENSVAAYTHYDTDGSTELYSLIYSGSGTTWNIIAGAPDAGGSALYSNDDADNSDSGTSSATIAETDWSVGTGTADAPVVRDLSDIGHFMRIHRTRAFYSDSAVEYDFSVQADGAHVLNPVSSTESIVWCTYKKRLTELTSLDGDAALSLSEVPQELLNYVAYGTYADFLGMDGQDQKSMLRSQMADKYLDQELSKPDVVMNNNTVRQRFRTHLSKQSR